VEVKVRSLAGAGAKRPTLRRLAIFVALGSTVAFWPAALDRWVLPKVLLFGIAALIAVFSVPSGRLPRWLALALVGAAALLVIAALAGSQPLPALMGRWPRYEGALTATAYLLAGWLGARTLGPATLRADARVLDRTLALVAIVLAGWSVLESANVLVLSSDLARPGAFLGNATDQGALAAALAVVLLGRLQWGARRHAETVLVSIATGAAALTVPLSGSRAALIALVVGSIAMLIWSPATVRVRLVTGSAGFAALTAATLLLMGPRLLGVSPLAAQTVTDRLLIWQESLAVVASHPILGVGPSGFLDAVAAVHDARWFTTAGDTTVLDSPHDVLLQAFVVAGPLGLAGLLAVLVCIVVAVARRVSAAVPERRALLVPATAGAGTLILVLLTHVSSPASVVPAAFLIGCAVSIPPRREPAAQTVGSAAAIAAWAGLVAVSLAAETTLAAGVSSASLGRIETADGLFRTSAALRPWDPDTVIIAAEALTARADSGDEDALVPAARWAELATESAPASLAGWKAWVTVVIAQGDFGRASTALAALRRAFPSDPWVAHRAGAVALATGDLPAAIDLLVLATELDPDRPEPWSTLAYAYSQAGDDAAAAEAQSRAAALGGG
jgi:O-antigen ligase